VIDEYNDGAVRLSRTYNKGAVLHVRMNCAEYVAIDSESSRFVCDEGDCVLVSWCEAETSVIVVDYCEAMNFSAVIVDYCDDYGVAQVDLDDGPLRPKGFVVATIHACEWVGRVRLYDSEVKHLSSWLRRLTSEHSAVGKRNQGTDTYRSYKNSHDPHSSHLDFPPYRLC